MSARLRSCTIVLALATSLVGRPGFAQTQVKASGIPVRPKNRLWVDELRDRDLLFPVPGVVFKKLKDTFNEARGSHRVHHALDIPAPRGTPILSTDSGRVLKLHHSADGGLMVYAVDWQERFIYYYAHLDHYREGLAEGMTLARGDTIGYVGTTGNAPPNTPHLHFAIMRSKNIKRWSKGAAINPYRIFKK